MKYRYLIIDGEFGGTGVKDQFDVFIELDEIPISNKLKKQITNWVEDYPSAGLSSTVQSSVEFSEHDLNGLELLKMTSKELGPEYKIRYYSDLKMKELKEIEGGKIIELQ